MNRIKNLFNIDYPIIQAGMVWCSGWKLASAVSNAGGLGLLGAGSMHPETLNEHIIKCKQATHKPFGVNIPLLYPEIDKIIDVVLKQEVKIVFTSAGNPSTWTPLLKENGIKEMFRRAKIKLNALSWEQINTAIAQGKSIEAHIKLTDKKGEPVCASLKAENISWQ